MPVTKPFFQSRNDISQIRSTIKRALKEDIGERDITTESIIPAGSILRGVYVTKAGGIVAGLEVVKYIFAFHNPKITLRLHAADGAVIKTGEILAEVEGPGRPILSAERVALNFLQRMSGIATKTRLFVDRVKGTGAIILDTRKTAPGLRLFDKWAVRLGGGENHRLGLSDMVLVKDNHIAACSSVTQAIVAVRRKTRRPIEVEVATFKQLKEAISCRPDRIMLDNMNVREIKKAVELVAGRIPLEVSGNVNLKNVRCIAQTGVNYISIGSLTHSVEALDMSFNVVQ